MTAPFSKIVNEKHDNMILAEQQDQAIRMVSRKPKASAKKNSGWLPEIIMAALFIIAVAVAFYVTTAEHGGDPSFGGAPISEMSISEQLKFAEEARYND